MIDLSRLRPEWRSLTWWQASLIVVAVAIGLALSYLPLRWAVISLAALALIILTAIDPLVGLGVALVLGPTKPLTDYFVPGASP